MYYLFRTINYTIIYLLIINKYFVLSVKQHGPYDIKINKCCEPEEILIDHICTHINNTNYVAWEPIFTDYNGEKNVQVKDFWFSIGLPNCQSRQNWPVYHYPTSRDKLILLPNGVLRHYIKNHDDNDDDDIDDFSHHTINNDKQPIYRDHEQGTYCMDKAIDTKSNYLQSEYAMVCSIEKKIHWTDTEFLLRKIINPICHGISIIILLFVAIIYFVLPTLRDLVGNIVTTITTCLIISQIANLVRIFTELKSHVSFMAADIVMYTSLLAAFFWLNSLGYYIWRTFRSRNVFLRVTDGRKYCWYSGYAWTGTACMAAIAVFAHYYLDSIHSKKRYYIDEQEAIGWLGTAIFFIPIAIIILINIYFYSSTIKIINRMNTYGRIHHKLKASFVMFSLMFLVMSISWLFLILSWLDYDGLLYAHIIINAIQSPIILYICILRQTHVTYLLKKSCCYNEPPAATDWGDEMTYMNGGNY